MEGIEERIKNGKRQKEDYWRREEGVEAQRRSGRETEERRLVKGGKYSRHEEYEKNMRGQVEEVRES